MRAQTRKALNNVVKADSILYDFVTELGQALQRASKEEIREVQHELSGTTSVTHADWPIRTS